MVVIGMYVCMYVRICIVGWWKKLDAGLAVARDMEDGKTFKGDEANWQKANIV